MPLNRDGDNSGILCAGDNLVNATSWPHLSCIREVVAASLGARSSNAAENQTRPQSDWPASRGLQPKCAQSIGACPSKLDTRRPEIRTIQLITGINMPFSRYQIFLAEESSSGTACYWCTLSALLTGRHAKSGIIALIMRILPTIKFSTPLSMNKRARRVWPSTQ